MVYAQQLSPADTLPMAFTTLPLSAAPDDLEALLSQTDRTSSIVLIYAAPTDSASSLIMPSAMATMPGPPGHW